jgi:CheY-like chemotaxis protein
VESQLEQGSRFTLSLPWQAAPAAAPSLIAQPYLAQRPDFSRGPAPLILLAEDNPATAATLSDVLAAQTYQVLTVAEGLEALRLATERHPALILMDIQMPGLSGLDVIRRLRADPVMAATPIIALTALAMPGDRERCLEAGASDYLSKPVNLETLMKAIEVNLNRAAAQA